jgi:hypothetical protein
MKFKDYLDKVLDKTAFIDEYCKGRHQCPHTSFGMGEKYQIGDEVEDDSNYLMLYGDGSGDVDTTKVSIHQEISFDGESVVVTDTHDNQLSLLFYKAEVIPHPTLDNEVKSV